MGDKVYIVIWEYKKTSGVSAVFSTEEAAKKYMYKAYHKVDHDIDYFIAPFYVGD